MEKFFGTTKVYGIEGPGTFSWSPTFDRQISISFLGKEIWVVRTSIPEQFAITSKNSNTKVTATSSGGFTMEANVLLYIKVSNIVLFEKYFGEKKTIGSTIEAQALRLSRIAIIPKDLKDDMVKIPTDQSIQEVLKKASNYTETSRNLYWHQTNYGCDWAINIMNPNLDERSKQRMEVYDKIMAGTEMVLKLKEKGVSEKVQTDGIRAHFLGGNTKTINIEKN